MIQHIDFQLNPMSQGCHLITDLVCRAAAPLPENGILHVFIHHTSAGLTLNENADPSVRTDLKVALQKLAPERAPHYTHTQEGDDDMPAHIQATLTGASVSIPIVNGRLHMGMWQGIYLCEFRRRGGIRQLTITVYS